MRKTLKKLLLARPREGGRTLRRLGVCGGGTGWSNCWFRLRISNLWLKISNFEADNAILSTNIEVMMGKTEWKLSAALPGYSGSTLRALGGRGEGCGCANRAFRLTITFFNALAAHNWLENREIRPIHQNKNFLLKAMFPKLILTNFEQHLAGPSPYAPISFGRSCLLWTYAQLHNMFQGKWNIVLL